MAIATTIQPRLGRAGVSRAIARHSISMPSSSSGANATGCSSWPSQANVPFTANSAAPIQAARRVSAIRRSSA